jgi:hypothetical protein
MDEQYISSERMTEIGAIYREAFVHCVNMLNLETRQGILTRFRSIVTVEKPYMMVNEAGLKEKIKQIFASAALTDFIFQFSFVFNSRWAAGIKERCEFTEIIARNSSVMMGSHSQDPEISYFGMPAENKGNLVTYSDAFGVLTNNNWLLMLVLSSVFLTYQEIDTLIGLGAKQ